MANEANVLEVDPRLAEKLKAGERVWLLRTRFGLIYLSIVIALALLMWFCFLMVLMAGGTSARGGKWGLLGSVGSSLNAGLFWLFYRVHVRFTDTSVKSTDQTWAPVYVRRMELTDIVAAWVRPSRANRSSVTVRQLTPRKGPRSRCIDLCIAKTPIARAVLAELIRRCELTEISPKSESYGATIYVRPGQEGEVPPKK